MPSDRERRHSLLQHGRLSRTMHRERARSDVRGLRVHPRRQPQHRSRAARLRRELRARRTSGSASSAPRFLSQCDNFNFALQADLAESTYCKMVLADDWLYPQCLAEMVALAEANPSVGIVSSYTLAETTCGVQACRVDRTVYSGHEVATRTSRRRHLSLWKQIHCHVPRRHRPRAPTVLRESTVFFDTDAALRILANHDFGFVHQVLSYFRGPPAVDHEHRRKDYTPIAADHMIAMRNHGPTFLTPTENSRSVVRRRDGSTKVSAGSGFASSSQRATRTTGSTSERGAWLRRGWRSSRCAVWKGAARARGDLVPSPPLMHRYADSRGP